jgi:hypothetical protein
MAAYARAVDGTRRSLQPAVLGRRASAEMVSIGEVEPALHGDAGQADADWYSPWV